MGTAQEAATAPSDDGAGVDAHTAGRHRRRSRRWVVLAAVLVALGLVALWAIGSAQRVLAARDELEQARDLVEGRLDGLAAADVLGLAGDEDLASARKLLASAEGRLASPLLAPVRWVPVLGTQVRSADALAGAGVDVLDLSENALVEANAVVDGFDDGALDELDVLAATAELTQRYRDDLGALDLGPSDGLVPSLADAHTTFAERTFDLARTADELNAVSVGLESFLRGPGRYLVLGANNAEMRAGSGMFLTAGILEVVDGRFGMSEVQSVNDIPPPPVPVPLEEDLQARWGWLDPNVTWTSLAVSPRFPVTADTAARLWEAVHDDELDGVLAVDPPMIAALMRAFDIEVPLDDAVYGPDEIEWQLLHDQYDLLPGSIYDDWRTFGEAQAFRRDRLTRIVGAVLDGIDFQGHNPITVLDELRSSAVGRHLLIWSRSASEQVAWERVGVDGGLGPDSLLLSVVNRSANKGDVFIAVRARVTLDPGPDETEVAVEVEVENRIPDGEVRYVAGPNPNTDNGYGDYDGIVTLNIPGVAQRGRVDGVEQLTVLGRDGPTRVVGTVVDLAQGETESRVFRFSLPNDLIDQMVIEPSARVPDPRWWVDGRRVEPNPRAVIEIARQ